MDPKPAPIQGYNTAWQSPASRARRPDILKITRHRRRVTIGFRRQGIGEETRSLADYRNELLDLIESSEFDCVIFDLTGVKVALTGLLGLLSSAHEQGCEVELLNPSQELQQILRAAQLDTWLLIRGTIM